ncbi:MULTISPECIES: hypothetical protein [Mycobacterium]|uniref:Uncharacterized protein n=3 Tax=Mycobacterium TaxID=1763 RepID=A0AAW5RW20_MYCBC|nr:MULTISPECIES: hypothetical protein [Mycobacterium]MBZ4632547.1 hypothetical protein [Mycobacterium avium subsp. hominissuis]MCV6987724.1 hypothetical protein [Mycobacterium bouchedurhonense]MCV6998095.1 hypothetical protein [Mycobacterium timonense]MDV3306933.1 hypothetical protein [Mycobacterium avium subsp. hominissuis]ORA43739.1 hypothetical protein BST19_22580 [Mycobacterium bouchedurhonense]
MVFASPQYGSTESDVDLAAILEPPPPPDCTNEHGEYDAWITELEGRAASIQFLAQEDGADPLLHALEHLRRRRNEIEQQMTLLVAYMREKVKPRPYTLQQIADAAGLSISGTRTFYDTDDVHMLEERIAFARRILSDHHGTRVAGPPQLAAPDGPADPAAAALGRK